MTESHNSQASILMLAYTNYQIDARVIREAEAAVAGGFAVDFVALRRDDDPAVEMIRGVRVLRVNQSRYRGGGALRYALSYVEFFCRSFCKITRLYFQHRYKAIHVNNMPDFMVFCALIPKLLGAKIILDIHDPMPCTFASKFRSGNRGFFYRMLLWQELVSAWFADRILTVHDPVKEHILVKHGLGRDSIHVIGNFADDELFKPAPEFQANGQLRLVFHGTILERYGLRNLMLALSQVRNRKRIRMKIVGEGDFAETLTGLIKSLNLSDVVEFVSKPVPLQQIPGILAQCNLGMVPVEISSITEYILPLKLLEYTAMGMPVITVQTTAIGHYFKEGDCLFYQPDKPETLAALLDRLAENPQLLEQFRQKALGLREKFLWSKEKEKYIGLLRELTNAV